MWSRFRYLLLNILDGRYKERNNRTPHPTVMKHLMARGPPVRIINTGGVFTTEPFVISIENCPDFQEGRRKTLSQYVVLSCDSKSKFMKFFLYGNHLVFGTLYSPFSILLTSLLVEVLKLSAKLSWTN